MASASPKHQQISPTSYAYPFQEIFRCPKKKGHKLINGPAVVKQLRVTEVWIKLFHVEGVN